jgi:hypothetical protein
VDVKADGAVLTGDGLADIGKVKPISYAPDADMYYGIGQPIGQAFAIGKGI